MFIGASSEQYNRISKISIEDWRQTAAIVSRETEVISAKNTQTSYARDSNIQFKVAKTRNSDTRKRKKKGFLQATWKSETKCCNSGILPNAPPPCSSIEEHAGGIKRKDLRL